MVLKTYFFYVCAIKLSVASTVLGNHIHKY